LVAAISVQDFGVTGTTDARAAGGDGHGVAVLLVGQ
jgi:hypothetical protein